MQFTKKIQNYQFTLYGITDTSDETLESKVTEAILGGITILQLRDKTLSQEALIKVARRIKPITDAHNIPLIINDYVEVARVVNASGVHLGQDDLSIEQARQILGKDAIIGVSAHTVQEAIHAQKCGADYIGVGALFPTHTKLDAQPTDFTILKQITRIVTIPVVGIGGIDMSNVEQLQNTGLSGIAVVSAIFSKPHIREATQALFKKASMTFQNYTLEIPKVLTIAGSDSSGGAGIQADLKTISAYGLYGMSVITALTAQNTCEVTGIFESSPEFVQEQLHAVFSDIQPNAIKIGMVSNPEIIEVIASFLSKHVSADTHIVLDPVMVSTSGNALLKSEAVNMLKHTLMPLATIITPNIPEAEILSGMNIHTKDDMIRAAKSISHAYSGYILIKGGHLTQCCDDLLFYRDRSYWYSHARIETTNTHGTGCTLSSAIACGLAQNLELTDAIKEAKSYVTGALLSGLNIGKGNGPLNHQWFQIPTYSGII